MSKATKRKHVTKEALEDYYIPEDDEEIVKIIGGRGNNLHEVENAFGKHYLVSMPNKFRRNIWVKRGDYVITVPIKEGNKVQGEIIYILLAKQIKYLKNQSLWPKQFDAEVEVEPHMVMNPVPELAMKTSEITVNGKHTSESESESESDESTDDELFENPNRRNFCYEDSSEEESSEYEDESEDDENAVVENAVNDDVNVLENKVKNISVE